MSSISVAQRTLGRVLPPWWLLLITGIAWMLVALIVLRFDYTSVSAIAILFGIVAIAAGVFEIGVLFLANGWWKLLHGLLAFIFIAAGIVAFVHPGNTFVALTDERGIYRIPLRVGTYRISVELQGFTTVQRTGVQLLVGQAAGQDDLLGDDRRRGQCHCHVLGAGAAFLDDPAHRFGDLVEFFDIAVGDPASLQGFDGATLEHQAAIGGPAKLNQLDAG